MDKHIFVRNFGARVKEVQLQKKQIIHAIIYCIPIPGENATLLSGQDRTTFRYGGRYYDEGIATHYFRIKRK